MKYVALAIAAVLALAVAAPSFAQPFADVPTDHWAFDAVAELAAKGLIEGYPDGTFRGDRAMTRYEMAMVVARLLARIEAIKIPAPPKIPPPEVTKRDFDTLRTKLATVQRLVNEFRAELAALGVRVTAVEEELAALRARLDNTFITGDYLYGFDFGFRGTIDGFTLTGFPSTTLNRARITFRGRVSPDFTVFVRTLWISAAPVGVNVAVFAFADRLLVDWASPWGITFRLGRDFFSLGPNGLLVRGVPSREGVRATTTVGGISLTAQSFWNAFVFAAGSNVGALNSGRAELRIAGITLGVNVRSDTDPAGVNTLTGTIGQSLAPEGSGWSVDWVTTFGILTLSGEWASYNYVGGCIASGIAGVNAGCTAIMVNAAFDLSAIGGPFSPEANVWYKDYREGYPRIQAATFSDSIFWLGGLDKNVTAWGANLSLRLTPRVRTIVSYETGVANSIFDFTDSGQRYSQLLVRGVYTLSRNASFGLEYGTYSGTTGGLALNFSSWATTVFFRW